MGCQEDRVLLLQWLNVLLVKCVKKKKRLFREMLVTYLVISENLTIL